ncbi:MAG: hypothetical protein B7X99_04885 [Rhizobiales bacterium 17-65-6]|nr:MAG: hypothetical protein B7X99_04885 [Rhizobiales bacterium 17-65-6]
MRGASVQGFLIATATAIILAVAAAFAAPLVVDWTAWRTTFESEATRTLGVPVLIRGTIDADLLPAPKLILRGVTIGTDGVSSGGTVEEVRAELSLGALMRGLVEARGVTLVRPALRLVVDNAGRLVAPTGTGTPASVIIDRLELRDGSLDLVDRAGDRTIRFQRMDLRGDMRDFSGPFRLEGEMEAFGARRTVRLSAGKSAPEGTRLRLIAEDAAAARTLDLDGLLRFDRGTPVFEGKGSLAQQGTAGAAWRVAGPLRLAPNAAVMETLDLSLGDEARPVQFGGSARLSFGPALGLDAVLNARSVDADSLFGAAPGAIRAPEEGLAALAGAFARLPEAPIPVRVGMAVDQLTIGGTVVREVRLDLSGQPSGWRIETAEAKLPGQTALRLSGVPAAQGGAAFAGELSVRAQEPAAFLRWAAPRAPSAYAAALDGPLRLSARITAAPDRVSAENLQVSLGAARLTGTASIAFATPARLALALTLDGFDLDPLIAAAHEAVRIAGSDAAEGSVAIDGRNLRLSGLPMGTLGLTATGAGGTWSVSRLALEDFAGLRLSGSGRFTHLSSPVAGELSLQVVGPQADGLAPLGRIVAGPEAADMLGRLKPIAAPVALSTTSRWNADGSSQVTADGSLGLLSGRVAIARGRAQAPEKVDLSIAAEDAGRALEAAGLSGLRSGLGAGRLDLTITPGGTGAGAAFDGRLVLPDASVTGAGRVRFSADGAIDPQVRMRLEAGDLSRLLSSVAALEAGPVPARLSFDLAREPGRWRLDGLEGALAGAPVSGAIVLEGGAPARLTGTLSTETLSVPRLLGLWGARTTGDAGPAPWSAARFATVSPPPVGFSLDLKAKRIDLSDLYAVTDGRLLLATEPQGIEVRDLTGRFGGGALSGLLTLRRRGDMLAAEGRLFLENVESAAILAPLAARAAPGGRVTIAVDVLGTGRSPLMILQGLSGQGTLSVRDLVLPGADPAAIGAVLADTGTGAPPDERRTAQMFDRALQRAPLRLEQVEAAFGIVNGTVRLSPARGEVPLATGPVRTSLSGSFDMARMLLDVTLSLEAADAGGVEAGGAIQWRGPLGTPERRVGAVALANAIAMRAIERETRRLEERHGLQPSGGTSGPRVPAGAAPPSPASLPAPAAAPPPAPAAPVPPAASAPTSAGSSTAAPAPAAPVSPRPAPPKQAETRPVPRAAPAVPPLAPPQEIAPYARPQPVRPELDEVPYGRPGTSGFGTLPRPPGLLPGE